MKRTFDDLEQQSVSCGTRSKRPKITESYASFYTKLDQLREKPWISATKTFNYMANDHLVDWLKMYASRDRTISKDDLNFEETFLSFLSKKGVIFENKVVDYIRSLNFHTVHVSDFYNKESAKKTVQYMKEGVPIIHSAPVYNRKNNTYGIIDLLVRSDYINKLFQEDVLTPEEETYKAVKLNGNYHYRVIDIKYHTLNLASDGKHLTNCGRIPGYKCQLFIYNKAIGNIQGYTPKKSYLLGRRWKYTSRGEKYKGHSCMERLGTVDFENYDKHIPGSCTKAVKWYRNVMKHGRRWTITPPSRPELYPNMCVDSHEWNHYKQKLAEELGEISMIWNCGVKQRRNAFQHDVKSWRNKNCNSKTLGIKQGTHRAHVIDQIIEINRNKKSPNILPEKITSNFQNWKQENKRELFVDFETFSDICDGFHEMPYQPELNIIFMIGVYFNDNGNWSYRNFIIKKNSMEEEKRIMNEFIDFYNKECNGANLYYWHAEKSFWERSCRYQSQFGNTIKDNNFKWFDLCKFMKNTPITIKGCFGFGLKKIVEHMKSHKMIDTKLEAECQNGMMAMIKAWNCYKNFSQPDESPVMNDIAKYNEFDCKSMYDILTFLRKKYN